MLLFRVQNFEIYAAAGKLDLTCVMTTYISHCGLWLDASECDLPNEFNIVEYRLPCPRYFILSNITKILSDIVVDRANIIRVSLAIP